MTSRVPTSRHGSAGGYTLVEVLIVVAILGLAAAIVVPQMLAAGTLGVQAAARMIVSDLIFAQNDAMAQQTSRQVVFDATNDQYKLADKDGNTLDAAWMSGKVHVVEFDEDRRFEGVDILSASFGGDTTIMFDDVGAPDTGGTIELEFENHRYRITVAEFTGRITVDKVTSGG